MSNMGLFHCVSYQKLLIADDSLAALEIVFSRCQKLREVFGHAIWRPDGECSVCKNCIKPVQILRAFSEDPNDSNIKCEWCQLRYQPRMTRSFPNMYTVELLFYGPIQTIHILKEQYRDATTEQLRSDAPAVYESAILHFGSISAAYAIIGVTRQQRRCKDWRKKILPFLGKLPDSEIARVVGVSSSTIGRYRERKYIPRFRWSEVKTEDT